LDVSYGCTFPGSPAQAMKNLLFERASVVFNLAALYSQLAANEDRSSSDGLKRALNFAQVSLFQMFPG
jgi:programmed cell death 6-interacting protein